ncbi:hypothetical protein ACFQ5N_02355 [Lutibacter holmesii]|uniref:Uncharacterized protein n=1 Tax=Lutibacter holmesii TaxID=1137985 RepID=A0ABW3WKM9_9FLAO
MIYSEDQKPPTSELKKLQLRKFWFYNINPITGFRDSKQHPQPAYDGTAEVIETKKPAFRLAI